ncbi:MAG: hypothetical protein ACRD5G_14440, partial [Candidatus Acidiferrales bacterium]
PTTSTRLPSSSIAGFMPGTISFRKFVKTKFEIRNSKFARHGVEANFELRVLNFASQQLHPSYRRS